MRPKTLILIVAAVGCGLAASYMTSRLLAERNKEQPVEEEKVTVLVARQKIAMGTLVKEPEKLFMEKVFTKGQEPKKALTSFDQVKDKRLNKPLATEQFVTSEDLIDAKSGDLSAMVPPGMRAVAIRANMETSSGGWVLPNSRVDVIVTVRKGDDQSWSRIVMQNMLVLAVDLVRDRDPEKNAIIPSVVTLACTPAEAEQLAMAQSMGEIRLVLRPYGEEQPVHTKGARPVDIARANSAASSGVAQETENADPRLPPGVDSIPDFGPAAKPSQPTPPEPPKVEPPPPPKTHTLVIQNGKSVTETVFVVGHDGTITTLDIEKQELQNRPQKKAPARAPAQDPTQEPAQPEKDAAAEPAPSK
ncbi:MAG TPA: Flp pilus assembly protein CpaB [Gemmataceae bacterium]|nr:Flp pilus assembly protein CpaB [Gemmataceae bacterium]